MRSAYLRMKHLGSDPKTQMLKVAFIFPNSVPEMAKELLQNSVLALNCLHNNLYHVCAVTVGMIWKEHQSLVKCSVRSHSLPLIYAQRQ